MATCKIHFLNRTHHPNYQPRLDVLFAFWASLNFSKKDSSMLYNFCFWSMLCGLSGCFDWHSSVHGHWLLASLLNRYPDSELSKVIINVFDGQFTVSALIIYLFKLSRYVLFIYKKVPISNSIHRWRKWLKKFNGSKIIHHLKELMDGLGFWNYIMS